MYGASFISHGEVTETTELMPLNPYAASKAASDLAAFQYAAVSSLKVIRARPFNHSGAGQSEAFVLPAFAAQIARIEAGQCPPVIKVGDLSAERDFLHIDDVLNAYILLAENAHLIKSGSAFNIASGRSWRIEALLTQLISLSNGGIDIQTDPQRMRPSDIVRVCGSNAALKSAVGWQPHVSIEQLLLELLEFWRQQVSLAAVRDSKSLSS
jgi:GDP-4-dehydro-6-deoxy-D-mannose reductase